MLALPDSEASAAVIEATRADPGPDESVSDVDCRVADVGAVLLSAEVAGSAVLDLLTWLASASDLLVDHSKLQISSAQVATPNASVAMRRHSGVTARLRRSRLRSPGDREKLAVRSASRTASRSRWVIVCLLGVAPPGAERTFWTTSLPVVRR